MEEAVERGFVALKHFGIGLRTGSAEIQPEHAANGLRRKGHALLASGIFKTVA